MIAKLQKGVINLSKKTRELETDALRFVDNIRDFLDSSHDVGGMERLIGYHYLFRKYIYCSILDTNKLQRNKI